MASRLFSHNAVMSGVVADSGKLRIKPTPTGVASIDLPSAYEADVWFKLPMYLPSTVEFLTAAESKQTDFLICNVKSKKPHVAGTVKAL